MILLFVDDERIRARLAGIYLANKYADQAAAPILALNPGITIVVEPAAQSVTDFQLAILDFAKHQIEPAPNHRPVSTHLHHRSYGHAALPLKNKGRLHGHGVRNYGKRRP